MAEQIIERDDDPHKNEKKYDFPADPEFFNCMLQPSPFNSDPNYIRMRRLLLFRKAQSDVLRCKAKELGEFIHPKSLKHSGKQGAFWLMHQWPMGNGYHLHVHSPTSLKRTAGVPAGNQGPWLLLLVIQMGTFNAIGAMGEREPFKK